MNSETHSTAEEWNVQALLDDDADAETLESAFSALLATPLLMSSLMTAQFVIDALNGNSCPDRHYTLRIMQFIARAEVARESRN